jgi:hypothetical protein
MSLKCRCFGRDLRFLTMMTGSKIAKDDFRSGQRRNAEARYYGEDQPPVGSPVPRKHSHMSKHVLIHQAKGDDKSTETAQLTALEHYGHWFKSFNWRWWVTLTFSHDLSTFKADALLREYINELEAIHHDSFSCLVAREQKTLSGCGKPAGRVHFHLLVGCVANLTVKSFTDVWEAPRFGGKRASGAAAHVMLYDPTRDAAFYCFKFLQDPSWDWDHHNLELLSPIAPLSAKSSSRMRRKLRRREMRSELHGTTTLDAWHPALWELRAEQLAHAPLG